MDGSLQGREELLLEHTRNLVQNSYDELGDKQIISSIYDYYLLLEKINSDKSSLSSDELLKLQRLHKLFYNTDFDLNEPFKTGTSSTLILDLFKRNFSKIEKLIQETDNTRADILKSLVPLMKVNYYSDKKKKDIVNRYLNEILIPLINSNTQSAIKADKLDETTTATGAATSAISASSFLSKIKEAAEVQQSESRRGEELEGAAGTKPSEDTATEEQQPKGPLKAPPSDDDLKRARQLAMEKALKEKQEKEQAKIKVNGNVGIGNTGTPGFLAGLIRTGMKQEDIEKTQGTVTEITPQNLKELFDSFFDILKSLAKIGAVVDLYAIVFINTSITKNQSYSQSNSIQDFFKKYIPATDQSRLLTENQIDSRLAEMTTFKSATFLSAVENYMYKVVKEVFDYTKDGLSFQQLIAEVKQKESSDKYKLMELVDLKLKKEQYNFDKLFITLFEYLEIYFFLFYFYSNIPDFYIEKDPEIIMKLTDKYNDLNQYFMELYAKLPQVDDDKRRAPDKLDESFQKKIDEFIKNLPSSLEQIKIVIIDDITKKINETNLPQLIKEETQEPFLEIIEYNNSDRKQSGGRGTNNIRIIKGGAFSNDFQGYNDYLNELTKLYDKFKEYADKEQDNLFIKSNELQEIKQYLSMIDNLIKTLEDLRKENETAQSPNIAKFNEEFDDYYYYICYYFHLLKDIYDQKNVSGDATDPNSLKSLFQKIITDNVNQGDKVEANLKGNILNYKRKYEIYKLKYDLQEQKIQPSNIETITKVLNRIEEKISKVINTNLNITAANAKIGKKETVSFKSLSKIFTVALSGLAKVRGGGDKYSTEIIKGGFPTEPNEIILIKLKYMLQCISILKILSYILTRFLTFITTYIYKEDYYKTNYIGKNDDVITKKFIDFLTNKLENNLIKKLYKFMDAINPETEQPSILLYEYELKEIIKNFKWVIMEAFIAFFIELFMEFIKIRKIDEDLRANPLLSRNNPSIYFNDFKMKLNFITRYYFICSYKLFYYYDISQYNGLTITPLLDSENVNDYISVTIGNVIQGCFKVAMYPHYYYKETDLFIKKREQQPAVASLLGNPISISEFKTASENTLKGIFDHLNQIKTSLETTLTAANNKEKYNYEPFSIYGGGKNGIELAEICKIFYNFTSSSNNIYSIFFIINSYYKYSKDEDKDELIKKLKDPELSLDDLKEHFMKIFEKTKEIFKDYIKTFLKCDSFIKNYYSNPFELLQYLYISFIYDVYKSIKNENIDFSLTINKTKIISHKSYETVKEELKVFFSEKHYIFFKDIMPKEVQINESLKEDIGTFMKFIYNYTDEENNLTFTYINNINELFSFITYLLLTLNIPVIKLRINEKNYEIENIKIHPYSSCSTTIHLPIRIHLNEIEIELMDRLLTSYKHRDLFKVLANEFYYLDLNFKIIKDYKFCINQEIMSLIKTENYDNNLINFSFYEYLPLSSYKSLKLLRVNFNKLSFGINYSILVAGSIFTEITTYNYLSLIYLHCYLLKNKYSLPFVSFLSFIRDCILIMKNKLRLELTLQKFMDLVINFKKNPFINKMKINEIDMNFIVEIFESKNTSFDLTENLYNSLNHFMKSIVVPSINENKREYRDELIKLMYIYLLPVVEQLTIKGVNTIAMQHDILTIKAMDLLSRLGPNSVKKKGGGIEDLQLPKIVPVKNLPELPRDPTRDLNRDQTRNQTEPQRDLLQQQLDMSENRTRVSTDPSIDMQAIIKKLQIIGVIKDQIEGINIAEIEEKYYKKLLDLATVISINKDSSEKDERIVVFDTNSIQEQVNSAIEYDRKANQKNDEDDKNKDKRTDIYSKDQKRKVSPGTIAKIDKILINIDKNLSKIKDELETYGIRTSQSSSSNTLGNSIRDAAKTAEEYISGSSERAKIEKIKENIKILEATIKSLEAYKDSDNQELRALLKDFKIIIDQKEELNLLAEPKTIVDDFKDFVSGMEKFLEIYVKILKELSNIYYSLKTNITNTRKSLGYDIIEDRTRGFGYPGFYNN